MISLTKSGSLSGDKVISEEMTPAMSGMNFTVISQLDTCPYYCVFQHPPWALSLLLANI